MLSAPRTIPGFYYGVFFSEPKLLVADIERRSREKKVLSSAPQPCRTDGGVLYRINRTATISREPGYWTFRTATGNSILTQADG